MGWHMVERASGDRKFLATYETKEDAEAQRLRLIASDPAYEDVLTVPIQQYKTARRSHMTFNSWNVRGSCAPRGRAAVRPSKPDRSVPSSRQQGPLEQAIHVSPYLSPPRQGRCLMEGRQGRTGRRRFLPVKRRLGNQCRDCTPELRFYAEACRARNASLELCRERTLPLLRLGGRP